MQETEMTMLYKAGAQGDAFIHGAHLKTIIVDANDKEAFQKALDDGWKRTTEEAKPKVEKIIPTKK